MDNTQIGGAVGAAIDSSGLSRAELARRVHMDAGALSRSINGERAFKSLELAWIADRLGMSVDEVMGRGTLPFMAAARATSSADAHVDHEIRVCARTLFERRRGLSQLGVGGPANLPVLPPRASDEQIAGAIVERIRAVAGRFVLADVDEFASAIEDGFGIDVWVRDLPKGIDGYSVHAADDGVYGIIATSRTYAQRIRFTIAHELAHLILGDNTTNSPHAIDLDGGGEDGIELRANSIAGAILIPFDKIVRRDNWSYRQIADEAYRFRVAPTTFATRVHARRYADELPSLAAAWPDSSMAMETYESWQTRNTVERKPKRLLHDLAVAYTTGETTIRPFALVSGIDDPEEARRSARAVVSAA